MPLKPEIVEAWFSTPQMYVCSAFEMSVSKLQLGLRSVYDLSNWCSTSRKLPLGPLVHSLSQVSIKKRVLVELLNYSF